MLMPIVSMNKMAMNESVATTCCYREVATPTAIYWEVLCGGWIGSGYDETFVPKSGYGQLNSSWTNYKYDVYFGRQTAGSDLYNLQASTLRYDSDIKEWTVTTNGGFYDGTKNLGLIVADGLERGGSVCEHNTDSCAYFALDIVMRENYHFESNKAHNTAGSGNAYLKAHESKRFSS